MAQDLPKIFDYLDYSKYLREYYQARHQQHPWFSYRFIYKRTGIDPGFLYKVFNGKKHLPKKCIPKFHELLKLNKREAKFFELLLELGKSRNDDKTRKLFEQIMNFSESETLQVASSAYQYYTKWYHIAIRHILSLYSFDGVDYKTLAEMTEPVISVAEARDAVRVLENLDLIHKNDKGMYEPSSNYLTTGEKWKSTAIKSFQNDTITLALRALVKIPKGKRDISTVTVTLSDQGFEEAREMTVNFRKSLMELAQRDVQGQKVFHFNIQLFPISQTRGGK